MEPVRALVDLPAYPTLAIIINCATKWVTSLALASTLRYARYPTLLIDCASHDGSREHFRALAEARHWHFHWLEWPLRRHGAALDEIFAAVRAETVLLVDSDLEILSDRPVHAIAAALHDVAHAYGAGFLQQAQWLGAAQGWPPRVGWYAERMWIPFVQLVTEPVRTALAAGETFLQERSFTDGPVSPVRARMRSLRLRLSRAPGGDRRWRLPGTAGDDAAVSGANDPKPVFVEFDTGARLHRYLGERGRRFAAVDEALWPDLRHAHGVSRAQLAPDARRLLRALGVTRTDNATPGMHAALAARRRLAEEYRVDNV